ncbi:MULTISPECIES: hypothetical protein [Paenibacillus]|jgi:hypothetical protein|uniref:Uncharacterized protein n=1 Tax=Paenibacillus amylolyticus TaxID=1451 RepID=A0ABD8AYZ7_PAEAM|nr:MULTISPECIES: hypothetical protein [Paenibacillus]MCP1426171.1 hypothetical protein [Paenibacillus xylanexedens]
MIYCTTLSIEATLTLAWLLALTGGDEANGDYIEGGEQDGIDSRT